MTSSKLPVSLPLPVDTLSEIVLQAKDYALTHGITMRTKAEPHSSEVISYAPFTALPTPVPRQQFEHVVDTQVYVNQLIHGVATDVDFLSKVLKHTIQVDPFTSKLFDIYELVRKEGLAQPVHLGLLRSDYMIGETYGTSSNKLELGIKQIEINTIASSFSGLGCQVSDYHRYILKYLGCSKDLIEQHLPSNSSCMDLAKGMHEAYKLYGSDRACVLFLVEDPTRNIFDQRWLEYELRSLGPSVNVVRRSLAEITLRAKLNPDKSLEIDGHEVCVVYYRDGYIPQAYQSDEDWKCRLMIERSRAIKCPSIHYHLAGTKKVQQELARPGVVERFVADANMCKKVRETFAGQYSLDLTEEGNAAADSAISEPDKYVLKPQLEGGGNNIFGEAIRDELKRVSGQIERSKYILMEKIKPLQNQNYLLRSGDTVEVQDTISELGVYGVIIGSADDVTLNYQCGHLVRTKNMFTDEGGVAAGFSCLDSPYLV